MSPRCDIGKRLAANRAPPMTEKHQQYRRMAGKVTDAHVFVRFGPESKVKDFRGASPDAIDTQRVGAKQDE
jgi:hypothetical protein